MVCNMVKEPAVKSRVREPGRVEITTVASSQQISPVDAYSRARLGLNLQTHVPRGETPQIRTSNLPWLPDVRGSDWFDRFGRIGRILLPYPSASRKIEGMSVREDREPRQQPGAGCCADRFARARHMRASIDPWGCNLPLKRGRRGKKHLFLRNEANKSYEINSRVVRQGEKSH